MKILKRIASSILCIGLLMAFWGCSRRHVLDGPGMENDMPCVSFELYRSDSYSQYNFWIAVADTDDGYILTGECRDENGVSYRVADGIRLPAEEREYLVSLALQELPEIVSTEAVNSEGLTLDVSRARLVLTYLDSTQQIKAVTDEMSLQIYKHFLPWFQKCEPVA